MGGRIRGAQPPKAGPKIEIVRITTAEVQKFLILGTAVFGQQIHWYGGRSHECSAIRGECENCKRGWPSKWKGYLHAIRHPDSKECFIELTPTACQTLDALIPAEENFRGKLLNFSKTKGGKHGRFIISVTATTANMHGAPAELDPVNILRYLWACKTPSSKTQA